MAKKSAAELNKELFDKVAGIKLNNAAAIFGTTSKESMLQGLRKSVAELGKSFAGKQSYDKVMARFESAAEAIDIAGISGLISEAELPGYYDVLDKLWAAIEHEKAPPNP